MGQGGKLLVGVCARHRRRKSLWLCIAGWHLTIAGCGIRRTQGRGRMASADRLCVRKVRHGGDFHCCTNCHRLWHRAPARLRGGANPAFKNRTSVINQCGTAPLAAALRYRSYTSCDQRSTTDSSPSLEARLSEAQQRPQEVELVSAWIFQAAPPPSRTAF